MWCCYMSNFNCMYFAAYSSSVYLATGIYYVCFAELGYTINREIFVYENIHVLKIRVNKFSRVSHKNILTRKFVKLKLLCMHV